jgi:hypothetical protein
LGFLVGVGLLPGCSGSSSPDGAAGGTGAGGAAGGAGGASAGGAGGTAAGSGGAGGAAGSSSEPTACAFAVSGGQTEATTSAPFGCANDKIEQVSGQGDFTASIGGGFVASTGEQVTLACTLSSPTAPTAGATWTMSTDPHAQGNCQLMTIAGTTASIWAASANGAILTGTLQLTFTSATLVHGTAHPTDVYYLYDLTLTATLPGLTAGATEVTVTGSFKNLALPTGS